MTEKNRQLITSYVESFNHGDVDEIAKHFAPGAMIFGVLGWGTLEKVKPIWQELIQCFRVNLHVDGMICEGDTVAVRYTERGKSVKSFRGGPVTGGFYEIVAMEWFEIKDGLIQRRWGSRDTASQLKQMGIIAE